jgi:tRNA/tmRNA/rRNA uracil-C5-methylase (TrmA/RlmC/RlmD family)
MKRSPSYPPAEAHSVDSSSLEETEWCVGGSVELTVEKAIYGGKLMGSAPDGRVVWIKSAQPLAIGDRGRGRVLKVAKRSFEVYIDDLLSASPDRVDPFCSHIERCGGCPWQAISTTDQVESLERDIRRMISRAMGEEVIFAPPFIAPDDDHEGESAPREWRHTARLHSEPLSRGQQEKAPSTEEVATLGFHGAEGLFHLDHCPVFTPLLNRILSAVQSALPSPLQSGRAEVRLSCAQEAKSGTVAVSLLGLWSAEAIQGVGEALERIVESVGLIHGAWLEAHTPSLIEAGARGLRPDQARSSRSRGTHTDSVTPQRSRGRGASGHHQQKRGGQKRGGQKRGGQRPRRAPSRSMETIPEPHLQLWGLPYNTLAGIDHPASAFMQAHQRGNSALVQEVVEGARGAKNILELYAGSGNFTLPLARAEEGREVLALEYEQAAVQRLNEAAHSQQLRVTAQSQTITALPEGPFDHILLDPPRAGAATIIEALATSQAQTITYISCHPAALARDLEVLSRQGWKVETCRLYHLFPHSGHIEVYCRLTRTESAIKTLS